MTVYLIRAGQNGPVKIGYCDDIQVRFNNLQIAHWEQLTLLRKWEGSKQEEKTLHKKFADLHIRGEWFAFSKAMLEDVGLVEIREPENNRKFDNSDEAIKERHRLLYFGSLATLMANRNTLPLPEIKAAAIEMLRSWIDERQDDPIADTPA